MKPYETRQNINATTAIFTGWDLMATILQVANPNLIKASHCKAPAAYLVILWLMVLQSYYTSWLEKEFLLIVGYKITKKPVSIR